eukprot:symbB.v1.2.022496.t1/scaffold1998.1/size93005/4
MPSGFDYSKWDNIELSDDEEDVHPNIDKASWFRYKHQNRVERDEDSMAACGDVQTHSNKLTFARMKRGNR